MSVLQTASQLARVVIPSITRSTYQYSGAKAQLLSKGPDDVVITFAMRSAMGRAKKGQLKDVSVDELLAKLFKSALDKTKLDPVKIGDIAVGTCHPPSPLYISRAAALAAGIPHSVPIQTINRLCSSGLMSVRAIANAIRVGDIDIGIAAGVESMSQHPRPTPVLSKSIDSTCEAHDAVQPMGWTSEEVARIYTVSREKQDGYALISHTRAADAWKKNLFTDEIIPLDFNGNILTRDDTVRPGVTGDSLTSLNPVFPDWQPATTTAGNASGLGDGAGLLILMRRSTANEQNADILGKYVATTIVGVEPRVMGIGPVVAIPKILNQLGLSKDDVDLYEINEAFASQFAYCVENLRLGMEKVNVNGGSIALTHPLGMTGTRQIITGLAELRRQNKPILCTSMCVGSGMGAAGIFVNEQLR